MELVYYYSTILLYYTVIFTIIADNTAINWDNSGIKMTYLTSAAFLLYRNKTKIQPTGSQLS